MIRRAERIQIVSPIRLDHFGDPLPPGALERLGTTRLAAPGGLNSVLFSFDGKHLITSHILESGPNFGKVNVETDGIRVWDVATGKLLKKIGELAYGPGYLVIRLLVSCWLPRAAQAACLLCEGGDRQDSLSNRYLGTIVAMFMHGFFHPGW